MTALAIGTTVLVLFAGCAAFILVLRSFEKRFLLLYLCSASFLLLGAAASVLCITGLVEGIWLLPGVLFVFVAVMIGNLLFSIAQEERYLYKHRLLRSPLTAEEVSRGLDWKQVERWMTKNDKSTKP